MRRLRIGDRSLRVRDEGESDEPPLVCIHGAGSSSVLWMDVVRRIAAHRRVVAPDLPGHGQSDLWHPLSDVTVEHYRDAVGTTCAQLGIARAILVGHSLGGAVALACAAAWPERVAGLVLINTALQLTAPPELVARLEREIARGPGRPTAEAWLAKMAWSPSTPRELLQRWAGLALSAPPAVTLADFRASERFLGRPLAAQVRVPSLVLGGADDLLTPPERSIELGAELRGARVEIVPRAGHMIIQEQPDALFAALDPFLAGNS
jgi:3-oxoadipate enol-lactonase